jgi:hypothetical protein
MPLPNAGEKPGAAGMAIITSARTRFANTGRQPQLSHHPAANLHLDLCAASIQIVAV